MRLTRIKPIPGETQIFTEGNGTFTVKTPEEMSNKPDYYPCNISLGTTLLSTDTILNIDDIEEEYIYVGFPDNQLYMLEEDYFDNMFVDNLYSGVFIKKQWYDKKNKEMEAFKETTFNSF